MFLLTVVMVVVASILSANALAGEIQSKQIDVQTIQIEQEMLIALEKAKDIYRTNLHLAFCKRNPSHKRCKDWFGDPLPPIIVLPGTL
jgi:hypothetical protein